MWDLRSTWRSTDITWRSTDIDPELSPISHAIRSSDKFITSRKPRNFNDPISKFERVVGELHAKLRWGAVFSEVSRGHRSWSSSKLAVIEAGRPQAAGTTQNNPLKTNGPKNPDPSTRTPVTNVVNLSPKTAIFSEKALGLTTFVTTGQKSTRKTPWIDDVCNNTHPSTPKTQHARPP